MWIHFKFGAIFLKSFVGKSHASKISASFIEEIQLSSSQSTKYVTLFFISGYLLSLLSNKSFGTLLFFSPSKSQGKEPFFQ